MGAASAGVGLPAPAARDHGQGTGWTWLDSNSRECSGLAHGVPPPRGESNKTLKNTGLRPVFLSSAPSGQDTPTDAWDRGPLP